MVTELITKEDANDKIEKRVAIVNARFCAIANETTNVEEYYQYEPVPGPVSGEPLQRNAFVFSREALLDIFFGNEKPAPLADSPENLLVILGAHDQQQGPFKAGHPTVILIGVNRKDDGFYTPQLPSGFPNAFIGYEFPPSLVEEKLNIEGYEFEVKTLGEPDKI